MIIKNYKALPALNERQECLFIFNISMYIFSFSVHNTVKGLRRPTAWLKFDVRGKENYG